MYDKWKVGVCPICGKQFKGTAARMYCTNPQCRKKAARMRHRANRKEKRCEWCYQPFIPTRGDQRYDRPACRVAACRHRKEQGNQQFF